MTRLKTAAKETRGTKVWHIIYSNFVRLVNRQFKPLCQASLSSLDEGNGIEETLKHREAKWHKSCFNKCSTLKLQRAQNRKLEDSSVEGSEAPSPVKTRSSLADALKRSSKRISGNMFLL